MVTYEMLKRTIANQRARGTLNAESMVQKLDAFLLFDRISDTEYQELVSLIHAK